MSFIGLYNISYVIDTHSFYTHLFVLPPTFDLPSPGSPSTALTVQRHWSFCSLIPLKLSSFSLSLSVSIYLQLMPHLQQETNHTIRRVYTLRQSRRCFFIPFLPPDALLLSPLLGIFSASPLFTFPSHSIIPAFPRAAIQRAGSSGV